MLQLDRVYDEEMLERNWAYKVLKFMHDVVQRDVMPVFPCYQLYLKDSTVHWYHDMHEYGAYSDHRHSIWSVEIFCPVCYGGIVLHWFYGWADGSHNHITPKKQMAELICDGPLNYDAIVDANALLLCNDYFKGGEWNVVRTFRPSDKRFIGTVMDYIVYYADRVLSTHKCQ